MAEDPSLAGLVSHGYQFPDSIQEDMGVKVVDCAGLLIPVLTASGASLLVGSKTRNYLRGGCHQRSEVGDRGDCGLSQGQSLWDEPEQDDVYVTDQQRCV